MTAAIFRAEFLRALPLIPWLLSLHGLMLGLRTRWSGELSPLLSGVIEWGTWALALVILIGSAWHDSPSRRECFLGTRPMKVISLIAAKFAALSILITLPFVVVEYAALLWADQPLRVAGWGALQTGLFATACVLATLTVTWVWSSRAEAFTGLGIALVGGAVAMALFLRRPGYLFAWIPISRISMPSATTTLTGLIVLTLLGAIVAIALRRRAAAIKVPAFLIASCLSLVVAREASFPHPHGARETHSALVHLTLSTRELGDRLANWLEIEPPGPALNANQDVVWNFSKLSVNGHRVPLWSNQGIDGHLRPNNPDMVKTEPIRQALFSHYGSRLQIPEPQGTTSYPATIDLPGNHDPARMLDLDIVLTGTILEWRVVADLPANGKATSRYGDTRWTIESAPQPGQRGFRRIVRETVPNLWLCRNPPAGGLSPLNADRYFLIDISSGKVRSLSDAFHGENWRSPRSTLRERSFDFSDMGMFRDEPDDFPAFDPTREYRLAVVRAIPIETITTHWKTPTPLSCAGLWLPQIADPNKPRDPREGSAIQWLGENPPPPAGSSGPVVTTWLDELIPRIAAENPRDIRQKLIATIGTQVADHPEEILAAIRKLDPYSRDARTVLHFALQGYLTEDALKHHPELVEDDSIWQIAIERGWQRYLVASAVIQARQGWGWRVKEILYAAPGETGLSTAEWQDLYRLYPSAESFRALSPVLTREYLEAGADRRLAGYRPKQPNPRIDALLELALARGRQEAPGWLHQAISMRRNEHPTWVVAPVRSSFVLPEELKTEAEVVGWFMAQDPARFAFDPASGKFRLH